MSLLPPPCLLLLRGPAPAPPPGPGSPLEPPRYRTISVSLPAARSATLCRSALVTGPGPGPHPILRLWKPESMESELRI